MLNSIIFVKELCLYSSETNYKLKIQNRLGPPVNFYINVSCKAIIYEYSQDKRRILKYSQSRNIYIPNNQI